MKIGFIGLGIMGRPMAGHLQAAGHVIYSCANRTPMPDELREGGAIACATPAAVAAEAECLILMLPDTPDVERVLFGTDGVVQEVRPGTTIIDMSSIDPIATRDFAARLETLGCDYVDAPVSGGEVGAKNAALTIMCGGKPEVFEKVRALLELMGKNIHAGRQGRCRTGREGSQPDHRSAEYRSGVRSVGLRIEGGRGPGTCA